MVRSETAQKEWRCFHCDEVFTDEEDARQHFGVENGYGLNISGCKITVGDVRGLELEITKLRRANEELENDARLWHESEADRVRRIGHVQWWQELDSREGEKLVLQERVRELEQALALVGAETQDTECKDECNPYISKCGAKFCSFEDARFHDKHCKYVAQPVGAPPPQETQE